MKKFDAGKWAEKEAWTWLNEASSAEACIAFHRYPDARSARGALPAQPADFLVGYFNSWNVPVACHLEVKETAQITRLPKDKIGQYGKLKLFDLAGFRTVVLVFRSKCLDWVYLERDDLFDHDEAPVSFPLNNRPTFPSAAAALKDIFQ